ncbi:hypothetical protein [Nonlabens sp. Hel1_33_55]|uniref:hypothetical protein n=1 Tax=Nonlabens sp. Hel1_33_55 TaxID=1336802 RepID=UPI0012FD1E71|nr:hypothetical protein [Nonlabens sp. Hel1_33_55]
MKKLEFDFGNIFLLEDSFVSELNKGVVGGAEEVYQVLEKALEYYEEHDVVKKRVWIANRTEKYSVKPVEWIRLRHLALKYLCGYCVVDDSKSGLRTALLESRFVPINFKSVNTLEEAVKWTAMTQAKLML